MTAKVVMNHVPTLYKPNQRRRERSLPLLDREALGSKTFQSTRPPSKKGFLIGSEFRVASVIKWLTSFCPFPTFYNCELALQCTRDTSGSGQFLCKYICGLSSGSRWESL
jgi:hypothetical protein